MWSKVCIFPSLHIFICKELVAFSPRRMLELFFTYSYFHFFYFLDQLSTGLGAAWKTCNVEPNTTVAVFGLGAVGLAIIQGAASRKAARIFAVDVNPDKFAIARTLGATDCINPLELPQGTTVQAHIVSLTTYVFVFLVAYFLFTALTLLVFNIPFFPFY
jgi:hypothetical protein